MSRLICSVLFALLLSGCGSLIEFYNRDVVQDSLKASSNEYSELGTLSVTAQRRIIVANMRSGNFCAEPPPEAADTVTSAIAAALQANIKEGRNVNAELASNFSRHVNQLYRRAHTVQLFRDAAFHYCVDAVNSSNGKDKKNDTYTPYSEHLNTVVGELIAPLTEEIKLYYEAEMVKAKNPVSAIEFVVCDSSASLEGDKEDGRTLTTNLKCKPILSESDNSKNDSAQPSSNPSGSAGG